MIVKLRASKTLWYLKEEQIRYTYFASLGTVRTNNTRGVEFIFLFFNLLIAWRTKETH